MSKCAQTFDGSQCRAGALEAEIQHLKTVGQAVLDNACVTGDTLADARRVDLDALDAAINKPSAQSPENGGKTDA